MVFGFSSESDINVNTVPYFRMPRNGQLESIFASIATTTKGMTNVDLAFNFFVYHASASNTSTSPPTFNPIGSVSTTVTLPTSTSTGLIFGANSTTAMSPVPLNAGDLIAVVVKFPENASLNFGLTTFSAGLSIV